MSENAETRAGYLAEIALLLVLSTAAVVAQSMGFAESLIPFGGLWLLVLGAWSPPPRTLKWVLAVAAAVGSAILVARFLYSFPLTASPEIIQDAFFASLVDPLPLIGLAVLVASALHLVGRSSMLTSASARHSFEMLPLLVISLIVYQFGLAWMWQVTEATSIPYASVCLMAAVAFQSLSWLHTRRIPFAAHGFLAAQVCALVLITAHALVLIPLIGPRYGFSTESLTGVVASTSGFLLFAGLVASKLSVPGAAMRFKLALSVVLLVVTASTCSRVELLREITPPGISAFPGMP